MDALSKAFICLLNFCLFLATCHSFSSFPHDLHLKGRLISQNEKSKNKNYEFTTFYYNQTIDHFNYRPESYRKFKQRYLMNTKYWGGPKNNSPWFVFLGAEESIDSDIQAVGFLNQYAPHFKALIVFIEHRFYGQSNPDGGMASTINNMEDRGYFNSAQALADYAEIILYLKKKFKAQHCPVIVFGGSYGGMLATWFRLKYPHVALGALASSAPILMTVKAPYIFYDWVSKDFRETSETCYNTIKQSWGEINKLCSTADGLSVLTETFKLCSPLKSSKDVSDLKLLLKSVYREAAQYDAPPTSPVNLVCKAIDGAPNGTSILQKVFAGFAQLVSVDEKRNCYLSLRQDMQGLIDTIRGFFWQVCTEIVDVHGTSNNTMFEPDPWTIQKYMKHCENEYGVKPRPSWLDVYYGGEDIKLYLHNFASNIIFYNGLRDPYSQLSVLENLSDTLLAINAPAGSHGLDLLTASSTDPEWLVMVREKEAAIIKDWIAKYNVDLAAFLKA